MNDEAALIEKAKREPEAFRQLYRAYFPRIYGYIAYRVGRETDAEDLTADVFARVIDALDRFDDRGEGAFAAWIFRIAYKCVVQFYRQRRGETISFDDQSDIRARIQQLSPRQQEIITLHYFGGLRNKEIAAVLGLDERTIAAHMSNLRYEIEREMA